MTDEPEPAAEPATIPSLVHAFLLCALERTRFLDEQKALRAAGTAADWTVSEPRSRALDERLLALGRELEIRVLQGALDDWARSAGVAGLEVGP